MPKVLSTDPFQLVASDDGLYWSKFPDGEALLSVAVSAAGEFSNVAYRLYDPVVGWGSWILGTDPSQVGVVSNIVATLYSPITGFADLSNVLPDTIVESAPIRISVEGHELQIRRRSSVIEGASRFVNVLVGDVALGWSVITQESVTPPPPVVTGDVRFPYWPTPISTEVPSGTVHTIPLNVSSFNGNTAGVQPGDVINVDGGTRTSLTISNVYGTAENPVLIRNNPASASRVNIVRTGTGSGGAIFELYNCQNVVLDGTFKWQGAAQDAITHGFFVSYTPTLPTVTEHGNTPTWFLRVAGVSTKYKVRGVEIDGQWVQGLTDSSAGIGISFNDHTVTRNQLLWREDIVLEYCYVYKAYTEGFYIGPNFDETRVAFRNVKVRYNRVEDTGWDGMDLKFTLYNTSEIYNNVFMRMGLRQRIGQQGSGIGCNCGQIYNNFVYQPAMQGIQIYSRAPGPNYVYEGITIPDGECHVYNNVVVDAGNYPPAGNGYGIVINRAPEAHIIYGHIYNNTVIRPNDTALRIGSSLPAGVVRDNIVCDRVGTLYAGPMTTANNLDTTVAALNFVDPNNDNYRLTTDSPAKDAGSLTGFPALDFAHTSRPQGAGADIGAFEFVQEVNTARNIWFENAFETGQIQNTIGEIDGFFMQTLPEPQTGSESISTSQGGFGPDSGTDTRVVASEIWNGELITPRQGSYFLRSAIKYDKDYREFNNIDTTLPYSPGTDAWIDDKPRNAMVLTNSTQRVLFDEEAWLGLSLYIPASWEHELGVKDSRGTSGSVAVFPTTSATFFTIRDYVPSGETMTNWYLYFNTSATSATEGGVSQTVFLDTFEHDIGRWTDWVFQFRANPFSVATNPAAEGIPYGQNKLFQPNRGILRVWKQTGPTRAMTLVHNIYNAPVGLVPTTVDDILVKFQQYKFGWRRNPTTINGWVYKGFDEIRFGTTPRHGTGFSDVDVIQRAMP